MLTSSVHPWSTRRTKRLAVAVTLGSMFVALLSKATHAPSTEMSPANEAAFGWSPFVVRLTCSITPV